MDSDRGDLVRFQQARSRAGQLQVRLAAVARALSDSYQQTARQHAQLAVNRPPPTTVDHLVMAKTCRALADRAISVAQTWDEQDESDDNAPPCPRCASAIPRDILVRVRDMTFGEDASRIRTGAGPQVMSSIRNLATSLHRLSRATNVAAALRRHGRNALRPLQLLKID